MTIYKQDLLKLLENEDLKNNPELHKELHTLWEGFSYIIYPRYLNGLSIDACKYLFKNNLDPKDMLEAALEQEAGEKRDQLIDLALTKKIDWNNVYISNAQSLTIMEAEKLLDKGASGNLILDAAFGQESGEKRDKLIDLALTKKIDWNNIYIYNIRYITIAEAAKLLDKGASGKFILDAALRQESGENRDQLIDLALTKKIDWNNIYNSPSFTLEIIEKGLEGDLKPDVLLEKTLISLRKDYNPESEEYSSSSLDDKQRQILELAIEKGADINKAFAEFISKYYGYYHTIDDQKFYIVIPDNILKVFLQDYSLKPILVLEYAASNNMIELAKLAIDYGADVNSKCSDEDYLLISKVAMSKNLEMLDLFLENTSNIEMTAEEYVISILRAGFNFSTELVAKLPITFNDNQLYEVFRSHGSSELKSKGFLDLYNLIKEFSLAKKGIKTSLSREEIDILDAEYCIGDIKKYQNIKCTNKYGYSPLHLSMISGKYDEAAQMIKDGADIYSVSNNNITPIQLLGDDFGNNNKTDIAAIMSEIIDDVDIEVNNGETIADTLIDNETIQKTILLKTKDPLFSFLKEGADLFLPSQNISKTSIAISHGEGLWSSGIWATARLIIKNHPDVQFYLVKDDMVQKGGEAFIKQFDAVINPGAGDSYPMGLEEFSKEDCPFNMPLEKHYQNMLNQTEHFYIPYLGMCAGAQHFSMYHGGKLKTVDGYGKGHHQITFIKGTLPHFLSLNKDQQEKALSNCEFPEITFKGDTAHHFAAVNEKLVGEMQLGAVSEDGIAMAYTHSNIRFATQYHPEHYYSNSSEFNHQALWLDNFVDMAVMHHDYRVNNGIHPMEYFAQIQEILSGCMSIQEAVVLNGDDISSL